MKYLWEYHGGRTNEEVTSMFQKARDHNVTGICYHSARDVDVHERASKIAHSMNLEYHAWLMVFLKHDSSVDEYAINYLGQDSLNHPAYVPHYHFLCPNNPKVRSDLLDFTRKVASMPDVDYIQLDYIRYPDVKMGKGLWEKYHLTFEEEYQPADYCYCPTCVDLFKKRSGIDIKLVEDPRKCPEWVEFRINCVNEVVKEIADVVHKFKKRVSCDVFPGPVSVNYVRQRWEDWDVDMFLPMNYNDFHGEGVEWIGDVVRDEKMKSDKKKALLISGLFVNDKPSKRGETKDPEEMGLDDKELKEAITVSLRNGANGISIYSLTRLTDEDWRVLKEM
ncbi:hypothetical protein EIN_371690 [Entamoeba invadens IP1]|uniref:Uncharacterized protein n=1 Tax=Entamoeba invadens IP1 TaxID=370355 RepID=A0A0A1UGK6_ENTIV|nr:hypothetical protein EIN_371690 [Entamoeba invadens IP1]ELP92757.1 hypothetical protein EIN_371690 [Entamoeba invadens IP1]|eukprot:XP_004259528.1 hypothetical protein EIN_371690 [Entamoeba invadens IP1]